MTLHQFSKHLTALYNDYCEALVKAEEDGKGRYTDEDFKDFENFIRFVKNNY